MFKCISKSSWKRICEYVGSKKNYNKPKKGKQNNLSPTTEQIMTPTKPLPDDNGNNGDKTYDL